MSGGLVAIHPVNGAFALPLPRALGRFNRRVTNPAVEPVLLRLPGFGRVVHVGRRSGATYRTPMLAFRRGDRVTFALTYGPRADWVQNVLASGECRFETGSSTIRLSAPRLYRDPARRAVPRAVAIALGIFGVDDFLELSTVHPQRIQNDRKLQRLRGGVSGTVWLRSGVPPMTIAMSPSPETVAESSDVTPTVASVQRSSWYDPDASAWEPQPPELFEALRASPARLAPSREHSSRAEAVRRP